MNHFKSILNDELATQACARQLAQQVCFPLRIYFSGEIGAGKSCFIRAFLKSLGVRQKIKSPTYSIIEVYEVEANSFVHVDLYRISDEDELHYLGLEEYEQPNTMFLIEWPEKVSQLPQADLDVHLTAIELGKKRQIYIQANTNFGDDVLQKLLKLTHDG